MNYNLEEIEAVVTKIMDYNPKKIILFNGEMGAGKTTLIKALCKKMGVIDTVSSPTFSLVNEYQTINNEIVYHFDLYRIKDQQEALDFGIEDYFYSNNWCFIEWSSNIPDLIPAEHTIITIFTIDENTRNVEIN